MKLRNKKTGEIWDIGKVLTNDYPCWETLNQICDDWEDAEDIDAHSMPLIKDEKIRKAVRAWWEAVSSAMDDKRILYTKSQDFAVGIYTIYCGAIYSEVLEDGKMYTIEELCGEEEE